MDIHETPASYRVVSASHSLHKIPFSQVVCIIWQALISVFSFLSPSEKLANFFRRPPVLWQFKIAAHGDARLWFTEVDEGDGIF